MKKILVVDESQAVRETIALVLGRDFAVAQRASLEDAGPDRDSGIELLIVGVSPASARHPSLFSDIAERFPCPILFLVDSQTAAAVKIPHANAECLAKPFNPYELKEKVSCLLAEASAAPRLLATAWTSAGEAARYLDYPFVPASVSTAAKNFARTPFPLLVLAEPGCGQERVARALHALNDRAGPWLSAHASEVTEPQLDSRIAEILADEGGESQRLTLFLSGLEGLKLSAQSALLDFLSGQEARGRDLWLISTSRADLLEKTFHGEFLDALYYRLAMLVLRLPALRDRQSDIPILAERLAQECAEKIGLGKVSFSPAGVERLRNYLWFGNLDEMEAVIARTLATHRKELIDAPDLILGDPAESENTATAFAPPAPLPAQKSPDAPAPRSKKPDALPPGDGHSQEVRILISELAHELKNPMVTVKTFSQLLADRFDDPSFRVRFQQTVNGDIQRMDDLLEALLDFSRFSGPAKEKILVYEQLRRVEEELLPECIKKETALQWGKRGEAAAVFVDKAQFLFAFKNILRAALAQVRPKSEIQMDVEGGGRVAISYSRDAAGVGALNEYLGVATATNGDEALPLRILLANILLERNGGSVKVDYHESGKARIWAELPVADKGGGSKEP
ncbi:MAG: histidine kinase dimerization/phospho-acceptor domain-containing protein [Candidatus Binatia bacterium]